MGGDDRTKRLVIERDRENLGLNLGGRLLRAYPSHHQAMTGY